MQSSFFLSGEAEHDLESRQKRLGLVLGDHNSPNESSKSKGNNCNTNGNMQSGKQLIKVIGEENQNTTDKESQPPFDKEYILSPSVSNASEVRQHNYSPKKNLSSSKDRDAPSLMDQMMADASKATAKEETKRTNCYRKKSNSSFGLKKGFLNASCANKKSLSHSKKYASSAPQEKCAADEQVVSEKLKEEKKEISFCKIKQNSLCINEVQEALNQNSIKNLSKGEWLTPDFMEQISQNSTLVNGMSNPMFLAALESLQKNPRMTRIKFKDHPDILEFLNEFCSVMGQHFCKLGEEKKEVVNSQVNSNLLTRQLGPLEEAAIKKDRERIKITGKNNPQKLSIEEQENVDRILSNKELASLLMDPATQKLMVEVALPGRMNAYLKHPEYGPKLKILIKAGLLKVA